jgi:LPS export ABC transporter permease LptG/LPS export ABC transporter permease LptF
MLRILDRYVLREILPPFFISLLIFTFILTLPPVMRQLEQLVAKGVGWDDAARILLTLVPQALGLTIPMATLTGILIGLGRLSADRESVALLSLGVSPFRLFRPLLVFALLNTAATGYVMFQAIPDANQAFRDITWNLISKRVENDIRPRVFFEDFPGYTLYVKDVAADGSWKDVLVADTTKPDQPEISMAKSGRLVLERDKRQVFLYLNEGRTYKAGAGDKTDVYRFTDDFFITLDAESVFGRQALSRTASEKSVAELRADAAAKLNIPDKPPSPHPEIIYLQQKFSIPIACLVFAIIGLALGLSSAREGKMGGFVIAFLVVFAYYGIMQAAEAHTRGHYKAIEQARGLHQASFFLAHMARWWPNVAMGLFGIAALVWRAGYAHRGALSLPLAIPRLRSPMPPDPAVASGPAADGAGARKPVMLVIRLPRLKVPSPGLLDRYVTTLYLRVFGLCFLGLLGLFYISTILDKSEKLFKGDASIGLLFTFLAYSTPQFIYYVIPLAVLLGVLVTFGLLARSSELTVMKACGISIYRASLPIVVMSLAGSGVLFGLEQRLLAESNRKAKTAEDQIHGRPAQDLNPLNRRWIVSRTGAIYHFAYFDAQNEVLTMLSVLEPLPDRWGLARHTYATTAEYRKGVWTGRKGWIRDYTAAVPTGRPFVSRPLAVEPPDYFGTSAPDPELMTVAELRQHIADLSDTGLNVSSLKVELQRKLAFPFVTLVMTLLAVPFGVTMGRRGALYGIGLGIVIALSYWIVLHVFLAIGGAGLLPPFLAGWSANIIVAGAAAYLFLNTRT